MGVYVFKSKHMDVIKIGHYAKHNVWSRIAHRGFYSCICPKDIRERVSVDDMELLYWFPDLTSKDEKKIHKIVHDHHVCGEWFTVHALETISSMTYVNCMDSCNKEEAMATRRRL